MPRVSGPANVVHNLYTGLKDSGHEVYVFAPKYTGAIKSEGDIIRIPSLRMPSNIFYPIPLPSFSDAEEIIERLDLDIFHSHHPTMIGKLALFGAKLSNKPLVFTYHSEWGSYLRAMFPKSPIESIDKLFEGLLESYIRESDAVIVPNKVLYKKIDHKNIYLLPSAIRPFMTKEPRKILEEYKLSNDDKILLCVSRLSPEKGIDFLIEMIAPILDGRDDLKLLLVGDGISKSKIKYLVKKFDLEDRVIFAGEVGYDDLPSFFKLAHIFVYPSRFDTQGLSVVEAMSFGLPIVSFNTPFFKEVVRDSGSGITVDNETDFKEAVEKLINDNKARVRMGESAKLKSVDFDHKKSISTIIDIYKNLLSGQA
ncbi:MAG TPA: glycosyltransferase [Candidatus Paceibacterota bacterium]